MDYDSICANFSNVSIHREVNGKLLSDLNLLISEIIKTDNADISVYDLCVNCGCDVTWNREYDITLDDINWLKTSGKLYFFETINNYIKIETLEIYIKITKLFEDILELFSLHLQLV